MKILQKTVSVLENLTFMMENNLKIKHELQCCTTVNVNGSGEKKE